MAHFAIVAPPLAGHINALAALAHALRERGHRVSFVGTGDTERWLAGSSLPLHVIGRESHPKGTLDRQAARMGRLRGLFGVRPMIRDLAAMTDLICREAPEAFRKLGVDAVIVDQLEPGGALAAEAVGLPYASVATGLHVNREPDIPPPFVGWRYDPTERGRWRVAGAERVSRWLLKPIGDVLEHHCVRLGLPVRRDASEFLSPRTDLAQAVAGIDYPRSALPSSFSYVGPLRRATTERLPELRTMGRDRPLAFCSLGTLQGARKGLLRRVAHACADLDLDLVLVHCGGLDEKAAASLARVKGSGSRILVRDFVPQRDVLERADIAIIHGGFNTTLDALAARTRIVMVPLAFEQPAIAARLERVGLAQVIQRRAASRRRLRAAIEASLADDALPARLDAVSTEIGKAGGADKAATLIERAVLPIAPANSDARGEVAA